MQCIHNDIYTSNSNPLNKYSNDTGTQIHCITSCTLQHYLTMQCDG